jgi:hypothetical protein
MRFEELKWRANWFKIMGNLLEAYYNKAGGLSFNKKTEWHTSQSLDLFPGYYFLQCMLQLIARKQEISKIKRQEEPYDPELIKSLSASQSNFVGKEMSFCDVNDPLGAKKNFSTAQFTDVIQAFKIQMEAEVNLSDHIVTCAHKAIGYYKQRS